MAVPMRHVPPVTRDEWVQRLLEDGHVQDAQGHHGWDFPAGLSTRSLTSSVQLVGELLEDLNRKLALPQHTREWFQRHSARSHLLKEDLELHPDDSVQELRCLVEIIASLHTSITGFMEQVGEAANSGNDPARHTLALLLSAAVGPPSFRNAPRHSPSRTTLDGLYDAVASLRSQTEQLNQRLSTHVSRAATPQDMAVDVDYPPLPSRTPSAASTRTSTPVPRPILKRTAPSPAPSATSVLTQSRPPAKKRPRKGRGKGVDRAQVIPATPSTQPTPVPVAPAPTAPLPPIPPMPAGWAGVAAAPPTMPVGPGNMVNPTPPPAPPAPPKPRVGKKWKTPTLLLECEGLDRSLRTADWSMSLRAHLAQFVHLKGVREGIRVYLNPSGNLTVVMGEGKDRSLLPALQAACLNGWVPPGGKGRIVSARPQVRAIDYRLERVPCRYLDGSLIPVSQLEAELRSNPILRSRNFTYLRWLASDAYMQASGQRITNVALSVEDMTGQVEPSIAKQPWIQLFGERKKLHLYSPAQPFLQCTKCCGVGHNASGCKNTPRCMHCAAAHLTRNHRRSCTRCISEAVQEAHCPHPPLCAGCGAVHRADDPACPRRKKFAGPKPAMPTATANPAQPTGAALPPGAQGSSFVASDQSGAQTSGAGPSGAVRFATPPGPPQAPSASIVEVEDEAMRDEALGSPA